MGQASGQCDSHRLGCGWSYWVLVAHGGLGQLPCERRLPRSLQTRVGEESAWRQGQAMEG